MVQDWFNAKGLDRSMLSALQSNTLQVEAYEQWVAQHEVGGPMQGRSPAQQIIKSPA
jgi:hypothetical protein